MKLKKEYELIKHTQMDFLEVFFVEMTSRNPHGHDDFEVGIVMEGKIILFAGQAQLTLGKGDVYAINRFQIHSFSSTACRTLILAFQVHGDFFRRLDQKLDLFRLEDNTVRDVALRDSLCAKLFECARYYFDGSQLNELKCYALVFDSLWEIFKSLPKTSVSPKESSLAKRESIRVNRITDYIAEHYTEQISLADIASLENVSPCHASHFFKSTLGISFQDYLSQIRFEKALRLVDETDLNLLDVRMETGFSSTRYLNRVFQKKLGCCAKEYRKLDKKPLVDKTVLPTGNVQRRFSFEQGKKFLSKLTSF